MKRSELRELIREELLKEEKRTNTFYMDGDGLPYQVPYILPGVREKISFNMDDYRRIKRGSSLAYDFVLSYNDKMNKIFEKAEKDIKKLGVECARGLEKRKDEFFEDINK